MARNRDEVPEEEDQEMEEELVSLEFNETLSWRAGKPIATGELLRRLEKLFKELMEMDQETVDKDSLTKVAKELAAHNLLAHKEGGVKAYAAACLVDILKLCAPDAPFTAAQLRDIFGLFVRTVLPALWDPTSAYNAQHKYVLTSLAEVKSILLINDLNNAEELLQILFSSFFDGISANSKSVSGEQVAKDVEFHVTEIMVTLIDESQSLPPSVLDVLMAQFLRAMPPGGSRDKADLNGNQTTLLPKEEPEAYILAKTVCNTCPDKMARYVSQYFSDVILDISGKGSHANGNRDEDDEEDEADQGPSESDFKELRKAHLLLRELWRAAPLVLQNVVPQVDAELSADNVQLRLLATETLGDMIAGIGAAGPPPPPVLDPSAYPPVRLNDEPQERISASILTTPISPQSFAQTHSQAFHNFLSRKNDKSPLIRAAWTSAVGYIISTSAGGIGLSREDESTLVNGLRDKLSDTDEKVRLAAVKAIETFSFRDIVTKLALDGGVAKEGSILFTLSDRCRDKKAAVRVEAMALLGKLWAVASGEIAAGQELVVSALSGIPSRIFGTFYANDTELTVLMERVIFECLVPLSFPPPKAKASKSANGSSQAQAAQSDSSYDQDKIRAERILLMVKGLEPNAKRAFFALQSRQQQFSRILGQFVKQCDANNGGHPEGNAEVTKQNLRKTIQYICQFLPDSVKVEADLHTFATLHDRRSYKLIEFVVGPENDFKTMHRAFKEFNKRIQGTSKPHILDTLVPLLYRSAYIMFNKSHLSAFMDCAKTDSDGLAGPAHDITNEISQRNPDLFKTYIGQICKDIIEAAPDSSKENDHAVVETLKACASYAKKYPTEIPEDRKFVQALISYVLHGQPAKAAKYAVSVMMARKDDKSLVAATDLLQKVMKGWKYESPHFVNRLAAVSQLELLAWKVAQDANDKIMDMAIQNILLKVRNDAKSSDPEWVDDAEMDEEIQTKCWALKAIVNRLRSAPDEDEIKQIANPVFKLLRSLLKNSGELCKVQDTPNHHKARLRLLAGKSLLKICATKGLEELLSPTDFDLLSLLAQDSCANVRIQFVRKLQSYLSQKKLRPRFYTMVFLTAFEPQADFKREIETWIRGHARSFRDSKQTVMEATLPRLLSLLAHHPDYSTDPDELMDHAKYLVYYFNNVVTESNFGIVFKYAERVKQTLDGIKESESENLYVLSDMATALLRKWQERKGWSFQAFAGKVGLPVGLYKALPSHDAAQELATKQFLPEEVEQRLDELVKNVDKKKKRKGPDERGEAQPPQKKSKSALPKSAVKAKSASKSAKAASTKKSAKTPKPKKATSEGMSSTERRRSGRSRNNTSYVDRDSSEDDEDMLDGVAEWTYYDKDGKLVKGQKPQSDDDDDDEDEDEDDDEDDEEQEDEDEAEEEEAADEDEADEEEEQEEEEEEEAPPPAKANGRRGKAAAVSSQAKGKSIPTRPAVKAAPAKAKPTPKAKPTTSRRSSGRGKKPADDYDMDDDSE